MRSGCCWRYGHYLTCASSAAALVHPPAALPLRSFSYALRPLLTQRLLSYVLRPPLELKLRLNLELNLKLKLKTLFAIYPVAFLCTVPPRHRLIRRPFPDSATEALAKAVIARGGRTSSWWPHRLAPPPTPARRGRRLGRRPGHLRRLR